MAQVFSKNSRRNPYAAILTTPGALAFSATGLLARLPMSMVGIGTVLMIQSIYDSYDLAGRISAVLMVAQAVVSPQIARLIDRAGQRRVMLPMLSVSIVMLAALVVAAVTRAPEWTLYATAAATGATQGSFGAMVRARWSNALAEPRDVHTAYSLESALDEAVFVVGPVLATLLATSVSPSAGLVVALGAVSVGGVWFLSLRSTEPPLHAPARGAKRRSAIRSGGMIVLVLDFIAMGAIFGATDLATVAFATEQGHKGMTGLILAAFAAGSMISGLLYGARHWLWALWKRFALGMVMLGVGASLFFFVDSLGVLAGVMFVTGFAISPTIINGNGMVQQLVAPNQLTEGLAWVGTALGIGTSIGAWAAGRQIEAGGSHAGFEVVVIAAATAVLITFAALGTLRRRTPR